MENSEVEIAQGLWYFLTFTPAMYNIITFDVVSYK